MTGTPLQSPAMRTRTRLGKVLERLRERLRRRHVRSLASRWGISPGAAELFAVEFSQQHQRMFGVLPSFDELAAKLLTMRPHFKAAARDIDSMYDFRSSSPPSGPQATAPTSPEVR